MKLYLMHLNHYVAELQTVGKTFMATGAMETEHFPEYLQKDLNPRQVKDWILSRTMPENRKDAILLSKLLKKEIHPLAMKSHYMSVSDCYWVKTAKEDYNWEDVNLFDYSYGSDVSNFILFRDKNVKDLVTPDFCTNGRLSKTWRRVNGKDVLFKEAEEKSETGAAFEVVACEIAKLFPLLQCVEYRDVTVGETSYTACENFVEPGLEFVPAFYLYNEKDRPFYEDNYKYFLERVSDVPNVKPFIQSMLAFDYLIGNTDRHLGNFGFIRDPETLEYIGPAPLFDNGTCFITDREDMVKPFGPDQMKEHFKHFECIDFSILRNNLPSILDSFTEPTYKDLIAQGIYNRMGKMEKLKEKYKDRYIAVDYLKRDGNGEELGNDE